MNDTNVRAEEIKTEVGDLFFWLGEDGVKELEDAGVVEVTVVDGKTYVNISKEFAKGSINLGGE